MHPCVVLLGGGGTVTGAQDVDSRWFVINRAVSKSVEEILVKDGYDVVELIVDSQNTDQRVLAVSGELKRSQCSSVVQISHVLSGPSGTISRFGFNVSVLHPDQNVNDRTSRISFTEQYKNSYEYALTQEVMQNLSLSKLGSQIAQDLEKSKVLPR
jgi:hypothetical protein